MVKHHILVNGERNYFKIVVLERLTALKKLLGAHPDCLCLPRARKGISDPGLGNQRGYTVQFSMPRSFDRRACLGISELMT